MNLFGIGYLLRLAALIVLFISGLDNTHVVTIVAICATPTLLLLVWHLYKLKFGPDFICIDNGTHYTITAQTYEAHMYLKALGYKKGHVEVTGTLSKFMEFIEGFESKYRKNIKIVNY